ncbi:AAA family ATPase [Oscillatoria sp. FACHB-1407]|uniref:R3H domain-containing nucleic acid-binding protein n=1 Tax=Oscillatoria sp. FACHB-1407 TaxID=2692847 RepID=UPI0016888EDD|nr:R3H domain-containing nucleic acid-binding protein [Oscillatoria sp. FACHB-1407]MBD2460758.1 AAA family ATPase [Oscillatoria sp. FACHB-1407]
MYITDDLNQLLEILPEEIRLRLESHPQKNALIEVVLDLGRRPEARFPNQAEYLSETPISSGDLRYCIDRIGHFSGDNRAGIEKTLHRISAIRNRMGEVIGLTCRVGRAVYGTIGMIRDLVETGKSILMLGRPGVGKTTALREIARVLADELNKRVVIIDTSNEIAGDGDVPHPAIGRARRMQVARPELQHQVMIEAVENHMPEVIVIDEIGTELEAMAARTIAERGVQLVGTAHGNRIENLMKNPTLSDLVGGIQSVTLGDEEARRRGSQKSVLERKAPPTFDIAVEMLERHKWVVHENVSDTVDMLLRGRQPNPQLRTVDSAGNVSITREAPTPPNRSFANSEARAASPLSQGSLSSRESSRGGGGWRMSGQMTPLPSYTRNELGGPLPNEPLSLAPYQPAEGQNFDRLLNESFENPFSQDDLEPFADIPAAGPNGEDLPLHVYPYAVSRHMVDQIIRTMNLPIVLTKDVDSADTVLALRSHIKNHSKLRHMAKSRQLAIYTVKANNMPQIIRALQRMLRIDTRSQEEPVNLSLFSQSGDEDELEALEEARLAVEQIVIPKGQPVELLPRSAKVRKMQHELVEHYRLKSSSFGEEPNRRLRIYPA